MNLTWEVRDGILNHQTGKTPNTLEGKIVRLSDKIAYVNSDFDDAIRAQILESVGYRTQILEFIDMEHTPKNLLIRAVKQGTPKDNKKELEAIMNELHIEPMLYRLLNE